MLATSDADIQVFSLAASVGVGIGGSAGVGVSGAGASALNIILADTYAGVVDSAIASAGEGGSCGHHQVTPGCRACTRWAMIWALADWGDDLKPCR